MPLLLAFLMFINYGAIICALDIVPEYKFDFKLSCEHCLTTI